jgi:hypothetical protein
MYSEIYEITERLKGDLPLPNQSTLTFMEKYFPYNEKTFAISFYKVTENNGESFFWICNPFSVKNVVG